MEKTEILIKQSFIKKKKKKFYSILQVNNLGK